MAASLEQTGLLHVPDSSSGPEPEVPEDLGSHSHPGLPLQLPTESRVPPMPALPVPHSPSPRSDQVPHHIPVLNGMGPSCAFSLPPSPIHFSPPCKASLRTLLPATSLVARPGPRLPGEGWQTFGPWVVRKPACCRGLLHSLPVFFQWAVCVRRRSSHIWITEAEPRKVPALTPP